MFVDMALNGRDVASRNSLTSAGDALRRAIARLRRARVGRAATNPESVDDPIIAALQSRLESLDQEIDRLTCLASEERDLAKQEACLGLARDLQREARAIREQIRPHRGVPS
jgi:hypothetical protein